MIKDPAPLQIGAGRGLFLYRPQAVNKKAGKEYTETVKYLLFCGGGSAGHVVPNLAVMRELRYSHKIAYVGTDGIEQKLVREAGFPFFRVDCPKLVRGFSLSNLAIPKRLARAKREARELLERERPDLVFSKGGYASYPAVWAAGKLGIPVLTHESDLSAGLCTRMIAKKCERVLTSFPETAKRFPNGVYTGSPVRREILGGERSRARRKYGFEGERPVLLVFGGGSGSGALNGAIRTHLPVLLGETRILHICGRGNLPKERAEGYLPLEYEWDMGSAYACADAVLCRAGSNTVFETLALKKPALLIPLEKSTRGDQLENALYFEKRGLVRVLHESELGELPSRVHALLCDDALRASLSASDYPSGTQRIVEEIRRVLEARAGARE